MFHDVFPYAATPHSGTFNRKDPSPTELEIADVNQDGVVNYFDVSAFIQAVLNNM
jgi:hypothetical protein